MGRCALPRERGVEAAALGVAKERWGDAHYLGSGGGGCGARGHQGELGRRGLPGESEAVALGVAEERWGGPGGLLAPLGRKEKESQ